VLNNLVERGKLVQQDGAWVGTVTSIEELGIPEGIKEAIGRRLSRLSEGCNQMLGRASAFTSGFTWEEIAAISDEPEDELLDYLDEALGAQLVAERSRGRYAFTHALVRATLYDELSTPRRVRLHRRVAESLEALYANDIDPHLGELAAHYMASMGGDAEKAIEYSIGAGRRAMELVAWEDAAGYFRQALEAMPEGGDEERRCRVLLDLGAAIWNGGQRLDAVEAYRHAFAAGQDAGSPELIAEAAFGFDAVARNTPVEARVVEERVELIDEALEALRGRDSAFRALLLVNRVRASHAAAGAGDPQRLAGWGAEQGHLDTSALDQMREAIGVAERVGDPAVIAKVLGDGLFWYFVRPTGDMSEKREMAEKAVRAGREAGGGMFELAGWHSLFTVALAQGDMSTARAAQERLAELGQETKSARVVGLALTLRATLLLAEGRLEEGEKAVFEASAYGQSIGNATTPIAFAGQLSLLRWYQGRFAEMESLWRGLVQQSPDVQMFQACLAATLIDAGKVEESENVFDRMVEAGFANIPEDGQ